MITYIMNFLLFISANTTTSSRVHKYARLLPIKTSLMQKTFYPRFLWLKIIPSITDKVICTFDVYYIIHCRKLCKSTGMNWLKIGDVVWGTQLDQLFFFQRRPGANSTGDLNWPLSLWSDRTRRHQQLSLLGYPKLLMPSKC